MLKQMTFMVFALFLVGATAARAEGGKVTGKVVAVEEGKLQIAIEGDRPAWIKVNAPVKFADGNGKVLTVSGADVKPVVIMVKTKLASKLKVDESVTFEKGKSMSGC